jgi:hypothetical protein
LPCRLCCGLWSSTATGGRLRHCSAVHIYINACSELVSSSAGC